MSKPFVTLDHYFSKAPIPQPQPPISEDAREALRLRNEQNNSFLAKRKVDTNKVAEICEIWKLNFKRHQGRNKTEEEWKEALKNWLHIYISNGGDTALPIFVKPTAILPPVPSNFNYNSHFYNAEEQQLGTFSSVYQMIADRVISTC